MNITEAYLRGYMSKEAWDFSFITGDPASGAAWADFSPDYHPDKEIPTAHLPRREALEYKARAAKYYGTRPTLTTIGSYPRRDEYFSASSKDVPKKEKWVEGSLLDYDYYRSEHTPRESLNIMKRKGVGWKILKKIRELIDKGIISAQNRPMRTNNMV